MLRAITKFVRDEEGASAVEYGLLAALIAAVIMGTVATLGNTINDVFGRIVGQLGG